MMGRPGTIKRPSFSGIRKYFGEVYGELKKVVWPTRDETKRLTILVIIVAGAVGIILGVADYGLTRLVEVITGL